MIPKSEGGEDDISNAIPVCFECHAEIHSYNANHPRGRKFRPEELKLHKAQWLRICENNATVLANASTEAVAGPLQALIDELEYDHVLLLTHESNQLGCTFLNDQFRRALQEGAIAVLDEKLRDSIMTTYATMQEANEVIGGAVIHRIGSESWSLAVQKKTQLVKQIRSQIATAKKTLLRFLSSE